MKLIPEQISDLRKKRQELLNSLYEYKDYFASRDKKCIEHSIGMFVGDKVTDDQYQMVKNNYDSIVELLTTSEYVEVRDTNTVQIGTKFIIGFADTGATSTLILTDVVYGLSPSKGFVSQLSPMGKSVIGKKEGDTISYKLPNAYPNGQVSATIKQIIKDPQEYVQFIKNRPFKNRVSKQERREIRALLTSTDPIDVAEYCRRQQITQSQKNLLLCEQTRLANIANNPSQKSKLQNIRHLLHYSLVAIPPTDGTIGIGTQFKVILTDGENAEIKSAELINRAVSSELDDEYVERISPLGSKIFGLMPNDTFSLRKGNKTYMGMVINVDGKTLPSSKTAPKSNQPESLAAYYYRQEEKDIENAINTLKRLESGKRLVKVNTPQGTPSKKD